MTTLARTTPEVQLNTLTSSPDQLRLGFVESPVGDAFIALDADENLCFLGFAENTSKIDWEAEIARNWPRAQLHQTQGLSGDFLNRDRVTVAVLGTPMQLAVWQALLATSTGETLSYQALAQRVGRTDAVRAVASAVGANPVSWLIPCHRILRKNGALGGYRWGLAIKQRLLALEGTH